MTADSKLARDREAVQLFVNALNNPELRCGAHTVDYARTLDEFNLKVVLTNGTVIFANIVRIDVRTPE